MTQTEIINALSALAEVVKVNQSDDCYPASPHAKEIIQKANDKIAELIPLLNEEKSKESDSHISQYPPGYNFDFGRNTDSVCAVCGGTRTINKVEKREISGGRVSEIGTIEPCPACSNGKEFDTLVDSYEFTKENEITYNLTEGRAFLNNNEKQIEKINDELADEFKTIKTKFGNRFPNSREIREAYIANGGQIE